MARFEHLLFVCTHARDASSDKKSCSQRGSLELLACLKEEVSAHKLKGRVRVVSSGCLGLCSRGCAVLALRAPSGDTNHSPPAESWYTRLDSSDAASLFAAQVLHNGSDDAHLEVMAEAVSTAKS